VSRVVAVVAALACLSAPAARAAAPNYVVVSGRGLPRPVLLADWGENLRLFAAAAQGTRPDAATVRGVRHRPHLDLASFWAWSGRPAPRTSRGANGHGRFYPAHGSAPALVLITIGGATGLRLANRNLLEILRRHGVPIRL
jgi:hypothetical protein